MLIVWLGILGTIVTVGVKSMPVYMNHYKVKSIMAWEVGLPGVKDQTPVEIRKSLDKRFDVDMVIHIEAKDIQIVPNKTGGRDLVADYEVRLPMAFNVDFVYKFKEVMPLGGAALVGD
jgi:hypothetical protein